jgi:hypothetical protein
MENNQQWILQASLRKPIYISLFSGFNSASLSDLFPLLKSIKKVSRFCRGIKTDLLRILFSLNCQVHFLFFLFFLLLKEGNYFKKWPRDEKQSGLVEAPQYTTRLDYSSSSSDYFYFYFFAVELLSTEKASSFHLLASCGLLIQSVSV